MIKLCERQRKVTFSVYQQRVGESTGNAGMRKIGDLASDFCLNQRTAQLFALISEGEEWAPKLYLTLARICRCQPVRKNESAKPAVIIYVAIATDENRRWICTYELQHR